MLIVYYNKGHKCEHASKQVEAENLFILLEENKDEYLQILSPFHMNEKLAYLTSISESCCLLLWAQQSSGSKLFEQLSQYIFLFNAFNQQISTPTS